MIHHGSTRGGGSALPGEQRAVDREASTALGGRGGPGRFSPFRLGPSISRSSAPAPCVAPRRTRPGVPGCECKSRRSSSVSKSWLMGTPRSGDGRADRVFETETRPRTRTGAARASPDQTPGSGSRSRVDHECRRGNPL